MQEEALTYKEAISLIILTLTSSAVVWIPGMKAGKDVWLVYITTTIATLPFVYIYEKVMKVFKGKDLFDILKISFGKIIGTIISVLYIWYFFHLGSIVLRSYADMINIVSLPETPRRFPVFCIILLCILAVKFGLKTIGRWSQIIATSTIIIVIITTMFLLRYMNFINIKPILDKGIKPILNQSFKVFAFPMGEIVIFTSIFTKVKGNNKSYVYIKGLLITSVLMVIISMSSILILGDTIANLNYFPSFAAVERLNIGGFFNRIGIIVPAIFMFGGITKVSMCLLATCIGFSKLFNIKDYRTVAVPIGLMMFNVYILNFESVFEMQTWLSEVFTFYTLPFHAIFPVIMYFTLIIRGKSKQY